MAFSYGLTNPSSVMINKEVTPDLFKFYTAMPTRSTESTAANQRRPVLFTSLSDGVRWNFESQTSTSTTHGFYDANYSGNFYFNAKDVELRGLAHKSSNSSYGAYKTRAKENVDYKITVANQSFAWSSVVAYNTANQPNREICKCPSTDRYFCIKDGGGYAYNDGSWGTANWTTTSFNTSNTTLSDDGGFKHICVDPEKDHDALVFFTTNDSNKYLRFYLCNLNDLNSVKDYTSIVCNGSTTWKQSNYKYVSIGYLPKVGYLIFYNYSSGSKGVEIIILRTYNKNTGEKLPYDQYVAENPVSVYGSTQASVVQYGMHGWYCPWTEEYFLVPNASIVLWTKDGENWNSSQTTPYSSSTACVKFLTDGNSMVLATSGSAFCYSKNKGTSWWNDVTLSPNGFNTNRSNDSIVLPFKCTNNIGINLSTIELGKYTDNSGNVLSDNTCFLSDYIPVDSDTMYIFYGANKTTKQKSRYNRMDFYDSNYNWLSHGEGYIVTRPSGQKEVPCLLKSPSNAVYARVNCNLDGSAEATRELINSYKWYFAKESDFNVMTEYGDIVCN